MNKIITLIALLVVVTSAHAWNIDYSKYTVKKSSVKVEDLLTYDDKWENNTIVGKRYSQTFWSPDKSIVVKNKNVSNASTTVSIIYPIKDLDNQRMCPDVSYFYQLPPFINVCMLIFPNKEYSDEYYICSGSSCDQLIKSVRIRYYTEKDDNNRAKVSIGTFDYIGDCTYSNMYTQTDDFVVQTVTITSHIPTTQIPLHIKSWTGPLSNDVSYMCANCQITDIEIEYLKPSDKNVMYREFVNAYEKRAIAPAQAAILRGNTNPIITGYSNPSPADVNADKDINSADVAAVFNYILNGGNEYNGHAYVDLGLPSGTMWGACNVGAFVPEAWGDLYTYGEKQGLTSALSILYTKPTYTYPTTEPTMPGWEGWHYPTEGELKELIKYTTTSKATINGNDCIILTSIINGGQLVFPLTGFVDDDGQHNNRFSLYWCNWQADPDEKYTSGGMDFDLYGSDLIPRVDEFWCIPKHYACSLRMTCKP